MTKKKGIIIGVAAVFVVLAGVFIYYGIHAEQAAQVKESYTLEEMEPLVFQGAAQPKKNQEVYLDVSLGRLKKTNVKDGEKVKKGDVLLTYVNETVEGQIKEQKRQLNRTQDSINSAQSTLDRARSKLYRIEDDLQEAKRKAKKAGVSVDEDPTVASLESERDAQIEAIESQKDVVRSAVADRDDAEAALSDSKEERYEKVKARISGYVKLDEEGKNNTSVPLLTIYSKGVLVEATASEYDYPYIKEEKKVEIYINSTEETISGTISHVDDLAMSSTEGQNAGGVSYAFQVVPDDPVQYGFSVQVKVPLNEIRIPEEYVVEEEGTCYVFRYEGESAVKEPVDLEKREGYYVVAAADPDGETGTEETTAAGDKTEEAKESKATEAGTGKDIESKTTEAGSEKTNVDAKSPESSSTAAAEKAQPETIYKVQLKAGEILILPDENLKSGDKVVIADDKTDEDK